ncbi:hypothetical protein Efla_001679 [Eimeria flavescens]
MMLSEVDSWIREDSDDFEGEAAAASGHLGEGALPSTRREADTSAADVDLFLSEYEQPAQASAWPAAASEAAPPSQLLRQANGSAAAAQAGDGWPLLLHAEECSNSNSSSGEMQSVASHGRPPLSAGGREAGGPPAFAAGDRWADAGSNHEKKKKSESFWIARACQTLERCLDTRVSAAGLRAACKAAYYSRAMAHLYLFVLGLNVWILLKCLILSPVDAPLVVAEAFVTLMLTLEVCLRAIVMGPRAFFSSCAHLFDCLVTALCVALLLGSGDLQTLSRRPRSPPEAADDVLRQSLTALRVATQLMRIAPLALHQRRARVSWLPAAGRLLRGEPPLFASSLCWAACSDRQTDLHAFSGEASLPGSGSAAAAESCFPILVPPAVCLFAPLQLPPDEVDFSRVASTDDL